jgi:hypothetical protein
VALSLVVQEEEWLLAEGEIAEDRIEWTFSSLGAELGLGPGRIPARLLRVVLGETA